MPAMASMPAMAAKIAVLIMLASSSENGNGLGTRGRSFCIACGVENLADSCRDGDCLECVGALGNADIPGLHSLGQRKRLALHGGEPGRQATDDERLPRERWCEFQLHRVPVAVLGFFDDDGGHDCSGGRF